MNRELSAFVHLHCPCYQRIFSSVSSVNHVDYPAMQEPILPKASPLHRTSLHFTPVAEAHPAFDWAELMHSVQLRGLEKAFPCQFFDHLQDLHQKLVVFKSDLESIEQQRSLCHQKFEEAMNLQDKELQNSCRLQSKELKIRRSKLKDSLRTVKLELFENILKLPNKLRPSSNSPAKPRGNVFPSVCSVPPPNSILSSNFAGLNVTKYCGEYDIGFLAKFKRQEMQNLWIALLKLLNPPASSAFSVRPCLLSDFARLPAVEACSYVNSDQVIHLQHTHDDVFVPDDSLQPLINPYTRTCLVGSSSLAAFTASIFDCTLHSKTHLPIRLLSLGNIYGRKLKSASNEVQDSLLGGSSPFMQTKQISLLEINVNEAASFESLDNLVSAITDFWVKFQSHWSFRAVETSASELRKCEMARWSLFLVTRATKTFQEETEIEIASLSLLGEWVSRRSCFKIDSGLYPSLIYGNLVNLESILMGLNQTGFYVPTRPGSL